ncbi:MAG: S9 family peptidase, partial [Ignavibacteria bacterium]|nr:S9 family peptidase [Ignavibacteria bacterium]
MKPLFITLFVILLMLSGCAVQQKQTRIPKTYMVEQFYDNLSVYGAGFNADESKILVHQNSTGIFNVYELSVTDTIMRPLTRSGKQSCFAVDYLPGTAKFIYTADKEGDENSHLFLMNTGDTLAKDLTPWPNSSNQFLSWSADKKFMYIMSNKRDPRYFDLWKLDTARWTPVLLYQNDSGLNVSSVSWNERYIALTKDITSDKNDLYLYDRIGKTMKRISNDNEATWNTMAFE